MTDDTRDYLTRLLPTRAWRLLDLIRLDAPLPILRLTAAMLAESIHAACSPDGSPWDWAEELAAFRGDASEPSGDSLDDPAEHDDDPIDYGEEFEIRMDEENATEARIDKILGQVQAAAVECMANRIDHPTLAQLGAILTATAQAHAGGKLAPIAYAVPRILEKLSS